MKAKKPENHQEISNISIQIEQIEQNKKFGSQIRSRLPPLISIDNPFPLAPITENLTQTKSLLPTETNTPQPHLQKKTPQTTSPPSYLFSKIYGPQQTLFLTFLTIST